MTIEELRQEAGVATPVVKDKTMHLTPHREVKATLCFPHQRRATPEARPSRLLPGGTVVIVENEDGLIEYKIRFPDGHLGAIED